MKKKMRVFTALLCAALVAVQLPVSALADEIPPAEELVVLEDVMSDAALGLEGEEIMLTDLSGEAGLPDLGEEPASETEAAPEGLPAEAEAPAEELTPGSEVVPSENGEIVPGADGEPAPPEDADPADPAAPAAPADETAPAEDAAAAEEAVPAEGEELPAEAEAPAENAEEELTLDEETEALLETVPSTRFKGAIYVKNMYGESKYVNDDIGTFFDSGSVSQSTISLLSNLEIIDPEGLSISNASSCTFNFGSYTVTGLGIGIDHCPYLTIKGGKLLFKDNEMYVSGLYINDCESISISGSTISSIVIMDTEVMMSNCTVNNSLSVDSYRSLFIVNSTIKGDEFALYASGECPVTVETSTISANENAVCLETNDVTSRFTGCTIKGGSGIETHDKVKIVDCNITASGIGVDCKGADLVEVKNTTITVNASSKTVPEELLYAAAIYNNNTNFLNVISSTLNVNASNIETSCHGIYFDGSDSKYTTIEGSIFNITGTNIEVLCAAAGGADDYICVMDSSITLTDKAGGVLVVGISGSSMLIENSDIKLTTESATPMFISALVPMNDYCTMNNSSILVDAKNGAVGIGSMLGSGNIKLGEGCVLTAKRNSAILLSQQYNLVSLADGVELVTKEGEVISDPGELQYVSYAKTSSDLNVEVDIVEASGNVDSRYEAVINCGDYNITSEDLTWRDESGKLLYYWDSSPGILDLDKIGTLECGPVNVFLMGTVIFETIGERQIYVKKTLIKNPKVTFVANNYDPTGTVYGSTEYDSYAVYGEGITLPDQVESENGTFAGWVCSDGVTPFNALDPIYEETVVFATFTENAEMHLETSEGVIKWDPASYSYKWKESDDPYCDFYAFDYTGAAIKPVGQNVQIVLKGKALVLNKDYTVTYKNNTNPGIATAIIKGKGQYCDQAVLTFRIQQMNLANCIIEGTTHYKYTGKTIKPDFKVKNPVTGKYLKAGKDYELHITDEDSVDAAAKEKGDYVARFIGNGNYINAKTADFVIEDSASFKSIKQAEIIYNGRLYDASKTKMDDIEYTGEAGLNPAYFSVIVDGLTLNPDVYPEYDYDVKISGKDSKWISPGTYTIEIKGKGLLTGSRKLTAKINQMDLNYITGSSYIGPNQYAVVLSDQAYYSVKGADPHVEIINTYSLKALKEGVDYTLSYKNNKKVGIASVTIKGKGGYKGSITKEFQVLPISITDASVRVSAPNIEYTGKKGKYTTAITLTSNGTKLSAGKDYNKNIAYYGADGKPLGKNSIVNDGDVITAKITGCGGYYGTTSKTFRVTKGSLKGATYKKDVFSQDYYYYHGSPVTLNGGEFVVTTKDGTKLTYGIDYIYVGYKNNNKAGTATVTAKGIGHYAGTMEMKFTIKKTSILTGGTWW